MSAERAAKFAMVRSCEACRGEARVVEQIDDGRYRSTPCPWCAETGRMSPWQFHAWREHQADLTPVVGLTIDEVDRKFERDR